MWIPLAFSWALTASKEELAHYRDFIGPSKPSGWTVVGHPDSKRREQALHEAVKARR